VPSQVDEDVVWSELGHAYLAAGQVPDAIAAYLRSNDVSKYAEVIDACKGECFQTHRVVCG
jgi:clathrin heavy chain